jgi:hypothetical protein
MQRAGHSIKLGGPLILDDHGAAHLLDRPNLHGATAASSREDHGEWRDL